MIKGLYVHIPFCSLKCPYCDFTSFVSFDEDLHDKYIQTVIAEMNLYKDEKFQIETVYFGGGTPSILKPSLLDRIVNEILKRYKTERTLEITMEINPNSYSFEDFKDIKSIGVNRVSFGAQSFSEENLKKLGRDHTPSDTVKSVENAFKSGIDNINLDLIYGIEGQTLEDLNTDLDLYLSLPVKHISGYMLTAYPDTPLGVMVENGKVKLPEEELTVAMFELIDDKLQKNGFKRYELSNWAKTGYKCRHNMFYWTHQEFLGVGVSAWSFINNRRFGNTKNVGQYMTLVEKGKKPVMFREDLNEDKIREEKIFLGLRLTEGIDISLINDTTKIQHLVEGGYGEVVERRLRLLPKGIMVLNYIVSSLV